MKAISKFLYNMYKLNKIDSEKFKSIIIEKNLKNDFKMVIIVNDNSLKIVKNNYVLTKGEKYLDESKM